MSIRQPHVLSLPAEMKGSMRMAQGGSSLQRKAGTMMLPIGPKPVIFEDCSLRRTALPGAVLTAFLGMHAERGLAHSSMKRLGLEI